MGGGGGIEALNYFDIIYQIYVVHKFKLLKKEVRNDFFFPVSEER